MCWNFAQKEILKEAKKLEINLEKYVDSSFNEGQMYEILQGLINNDPIHLYASTKYTYEQMHEIRLGLDDDIDVYKYLSPDIPASQMKKIRMTLVLDD